MILERAGEDPYQGWTGLVSIIVRVFSAGNFV